MVNGISTKIESSLVTEEDLQGLRNQIEKDVENFELLAAVYDDLTEKAASKEEVTDVDGNGNP